MDIRLLSVIWGFLRSRSKPGIDRIQFKNLKKNKKQKRMPTKNKEYRFKIKNLCGSRSFFTQKYFQSHLHSCLIFRDMIPKKSLAEKVPKTSYKFMIFFLHILVLSHMLNFQVDFRGPKIGLLDSRLTSHSQKMQKGMRRRLRRR